MQDFKKNNPEGEIASLHFHFSSPVFLVTGLKFLGKAGF